MKSFDCLAMRRASRNTTHDLCTTSSHIGHHTLHIMNAVFTRARTPHHHIVTHRTHITLTHTLYIAHHEHSVHTCAHTAYKHTYYTHHCHFPAKFYFLHVRRPASCIMGVSMQPTVLPTDVFALAPPPPIDWIALLGDDRLQRHRRRAGQGAVAGSDTAGDTGRGQALGSAAGARSRSDARGSSSSS